ncbi:DUF7521 family protein [Halobacterium bonnevillei]|uniref:Uncharacterized protein n=1 Tax=Halobacterium bonnevillei TaxID=2692200 RepID=A0A6B0SI84_9EURY|nr:hypothetical protein [Halobacterium bonnevillei]MXR19571.1 hypothetical protein [Halobacterium bonnevillei]
MAVPERRVAHLVEFSDLLADGVGFVRRRVLAGVLFEVFELSIYVAGAIQTTPVAAGMLVVLYSLYGRMPKSPEGGGGS